jgi:uncharacterized protein YeaO (DUF488 family)
VDILIKIKRVYDPPSNDDGSRILVDRLWPRGMSKEKAKLDFWIKEIAPTNELRHWYGHEPENWEEFQKRYEKELESKQDLIDQIKKTEDVKGTVTLVYSSAEKKRNNAAALKELLEKK